MSRGGTIETMLVQWYLPCATSDECILAGKATTWDGVIGTVRLNLGHVSDARGDHVPTSGMANHSCDPRRKSTDRYAAQSGKIIPGLIFYV
jgi:hypothetical protein